MTQLPLPPHPAQGEATEFYSQDQPQLSLGCDLAHSFEDQVTFRIKMEGQCLTGELTRPRGSQGTG